MNKTSAVQIIFWGLCLGAWYNASAGQIQALPAQILQPLSDQTAGGQTLNELSRELIKRIHTNDATVDDVEYCVKRGVNVNEGKILLAAVKHVNIPVVKSLLESGANVDVVGDMERKNIFMQIPLYDLPWIVNSPEMPDAYKTVITLLDLLFEHGADVNACDELGRTFLGFVAQPNIVQYLISHNANLDIQDNLGQTVLCSIAPSRCLCAVQTVTLLLKAGAHLDLQNYEGETALMQAAQAYNVDVVEELLAAGANPLLRDFSDKTALDYLDQKFRSWGRGQHTKHESRVRQLLQDAQSVALKKAADFQISQTEKNRDTSLDAEFKELTSSKSIITWV